MDRTYIPKDIKILFRFILKILLPLFCNEWYSYPALISGHFLYKSILGDYSNTVDVFASFFLSTNACPSWIGSGK